MRAREARPSLPSLGRTRRLGVFASLCLVTLGGHASQALAEEVGAPASDFTFVVGGDMIGPFRTVGFPGDPGVQRVAALFRAADLGFANQEGAIFDLKDFAGFPAAENGGGYPRSPAEVAGEIHAFGIGLVSKANNHATDWGAEGLLATLENLRRAGVVEAGGGGSEVEARAPAYVETSAGRVALVSAASTFKPMSVAGGAVTSHGEVSKSRPGISGLHVRRVRLVTKAELGALQRVAGSTGLDGRELRIGDQVFRLADRMGDIWEMDPADQAAILKSIRDARAKARYVIFTIHAHETAGEIDDMAPGPFEPMVLHRANEAPSPDDPRPAAFETALFHAAIEAGADLVVRTGPHAMSGIELYQGHPIFYSLGSLIFDFGGRRSYTAPGGVTKTFPAAWYETVVPRVRFSSGGLSWIELHPIVIEPGAGPSGGLPRLADAKQADRILSRMQALSAGFGTKIVIKGGIARIEPAQTLGAGF